MISTATLRAIAELCRDHHPDTDAECRLDPEGLRLIQRRARGKRSTVLPWTLLEAGDVVALVKAGLTNGAEALAPRRDRRGSR